jgi:protein O-mannosyl-transferase
MVFHLIRGMNIQSLRRRGPNRRPMTRKAFSFDFLIVAAAAILVIFLYNGVLSGPFVFDDENNITENRHIRIRSLGSDELYSAAFQSPIRTRPVAYVSFALNYFFNGYNPVGYRFINILIHIINGFLLYGLARTTFRTPALEGSLQAPGLAAAFTALVWLIHPLHTQSVAYIVQRMTSLSVTFYLIALLCYARTRQAPAGGRRTALLAGCASAGLLGLGSKEIAATLPVFLFLYEWYFFQRLDLSWLRRCLPGIAAIGIFMVLISLLFLGSRNPLESIFSSYATGEFSVWQRLLTQVRVVCLYISLLLWPSPARLNLDYDFPISNSLLDPPTTLAGLLLIVGLLYLAVRLARQEPLASFSILWFFGNLVIESSVIRLETVFEHRTYLPSVMPALAAVFLLFRRVRPKWAVIALLVTLAAVGAKWTLDRNRVWSDAVLLWSDCTQKSPLKARPYNNLGTALVDRNRLAEAQSCFQKAIDLKPDYGDAHYNLGYVMIQSGRREEGIRQLMEAIRLEPQNYMAHNNLGVAHLLQENYPQAVQHLQEALRLQPDFETARNNLGVALKNQGNLEAAARAFSEAIRINPNFAEAYNNLGLTLKDQGKLKEAEENFRRALKINPNYETARQNFEETTAMMHKN